MEDFPSSSDQRLELAYDAAVNALSRQDTTLGNTRTRANNVLATAALLTSVTTGVGLLNTDPGKGSVLPAAAAWVLLALMLLIGALVLNVLWTVKKWHFGPSAREILKGIRRDETESEIREHIVNDMISAYEVNRDTLNKKQRAFGFAAGLLTVEVVALIVALAVAN